jgi:hypothetical protein
MTDKAKVTLPDGASITLVLDGAQSPMALNRRDDSTSRFSTGSAGYHGTGKVEGADGRRYQVNVTATLIGSKG